MDFQGGLEEPDFGSVIKISSSNEVNQGLNERKG